VFINNNNNLMKKYWFILMIAFVGVLGCSRSKRNPGRAYMPDMAYSRAYETYASTEALQKRGVHYNALPVPGTIARGDMLTIYNIPNDSAGYAQSGSFQNPLKRDSVKTDLKEAERLYMVNCGICHGPKLDGNGPLYKEGQGPYPAMPKNLMSDDIKKMADGTIFHVITYGKGQMGSYASQLNPMQRWMVVNFIRSRQGGGAGGMATADSAGKKPVTDTTAKTGK
jgi:mono/diheme cytochrome c family protein